MINLRNSPFSSFNGSLDVHRTAGNGYTCYKGTRHSDTNCISSSPRLFTIMFIPQNFGRMIVETWMAIRTLLKYNFKV
jgi:hypothetical protein